MSTTALSKAEQNALTVSYEVRGAKVELDMAFVKKYLVRGRADLTSDQELVFFMNTCKMQGLNPLVGSEVYCIKYNKDDPAQVVVGKNAYLRRAFEHPDYLYKEDGIVVQRGDSIIHKEGCCLYPGEGLIGGWCRVHFMRNSVERSAYKEVALSEYNKGMANWKSKPATMINKVAVSQCAREAFPKDYAGLYSEDELVASGAIPTNYTVIEETGEMVETGPAPMVDDDPIISKDQKQALFTIIRQHFDGDEGNTVYKDLLAKEGLGTGSDIPMSAYKRIMAGVMKAAEARRAIKKNEQTPEVADNNTAPEE